MPAFGAVLGFGVGLKSFSATACFWTAQGCLLRWKRWCVFSSGTGWFLSVYPCLDSSCQERSFIEPLALNHHQWQKACRPPCGRTRWELSVFVFCFLCFCVLCFCGRRHMAEENPNISYFFCCFIYESESLQLLCMCMQVGKCLHFPLLVIAYLIIHNSSLFSYSSIF